jgi:hypothetical protein
MTIRSSCAKCHIVNRILRLFLILISSSLVMTATVHAREMPGPNLVECGGTINSDGDADQSQGDSDKAVPHHHGTCHGQAMQVPTSGNLPLSRAVAGLLGGAGDDRLLASASIDPALRPPSA